MRLAQTPSPYEGEGGVGYGGKRQCLNIYAIAAHYLTSPNPLLRKEGGNRINSQELKNNTTGSSNQRLPQKRRW
jgi:hypothetical protein